MWQENMHVLAKGGGAGLQTTVLHFASYYLTSQVDMEKTSRKQFGLS